MASYLDFLTFFITLLGILIAIFEYKRQGRVKCLDMAINFRDRFKELYETDNLLVMLETNDIKLRDIPFQQRAQILGFLEAVEFAIRKKCIDVDIAFNFFGFYAVTIRDSDNFCYDIPKDNSIY
ncbi:hypothetical protein DSECCO2_576660 [anaerobic digester metagenome]